jgi:hypothetical protein
VRVNATNYVVVLAGSWTSGSQYMITALGSLTGSSLTTAWTTAGGSGVPSIGAVFTANASHGTGFTGAEAVLTTPVSFTANSGLVGIDINNGGGGGYDSAIINPDIEMNTTASTQYGVRLSALGVAGTSTKINGGIMRMLGTSTTEVSSAGTGYNVITGLLTKHALPSAGTNETFSNNVVNANI